MNIISNIKKHKLLYAYILIVFLLSSISSNAVRSVQIGGVDKIFHFTEYFIMGLVFNFCISKKNLFYYVMIFIIPIVDEFIIQKFSGRNVDLYDFIFNILGLLVGLVLTQKIKNI